MEIFEFDDYREIIRWRLDLESGAKRGSQTRLAKALEVHTTTLSQILSGVKPLSLENAASICDYFSLHELESEYFLTLVQLHRAGNEALRNKLRRQLSKLRRESSELSKVLPSEKNLNLENQAIFYSDWKYSAVRVLSSIPGYSDIDAIAARLRSPRQEIANIVHFLLRNGLCIEKNGKLVPGPSYTHLPATSPLISKHHANLRTKAMNHHASPGEKDLSYSSLLSLSQRDIKTIRAALVRMIEQINETREKTKPETMQLLALDWIEL